MKRYRHKTNSQHITSIDVGVLYPLQCMEVLAGQTTYLKNKLLFRFQPLIAPAMVQMNAYCVSFYVPFRLLWPDWNDFITGQRKIELPMTKIKLTAGFDQIEISDRKTLLDYLGFPVDHGSLTGTDGIDLNFPYFPFLAYHKIWNEHFRGDDEIQPPLDMDALEEDFRKGCVYEKSGDSLDDFNARRRRLYALKRINWGRDRFTDALLKAQTPDVSIPIVGNGEGMHFRFEQDNVGQLIVQNPGNDYAIAGYYKTEGSRLNLNATAHYDSGLKDFSLDQLREATDLYNFFQNRAIYGSSVEDYFRKYNLKNLDNRLQRSEVIGGFADTIQISDIIATSGDALGKQGGHAIGYLGKRSFKHYAPEHGLIMTMVYLRPKADYVGGIPRFFFKRDMLDFFQYEFNSGYQPIYKQEIGNEKSNRKIPSNQDELEIFGYEERYAEYRDEANMVTGEVRPGKPLAHWANPRHWNKLPNLNSEFLVCNPSNQIWASPNTDKAIVYMLRNVTKKSFVPHHSKLFFKL